MSPYLVVSISNSSDAGSALFVSNPLFKAFHAEGCRKNHDLRSSRAALRGMLASVVVMCFTISSSANLQASKSSQHDLSR